MSAPGPAKRIKLVSNGVRKPQTNGHVGKQHKNIPWVDVSDDEDRRRKMPLANGTSSGHHGQGKNARRKKARLSGPDGQLVNGSGAGPTAALLQEQRKQLPIAKGTSTCSCVHTQC
jgi:hypothetical protein